MNQHKSTIQSLQLRIKTYHLQIQKQHTEYEQGCHRLKQHNDKYVQTIQGHEDTINSLESRNHQIRIRN